MSFFVVHVQKVSVLKQYIIISKNVLKFLRGEHILLLQQFSISLRTGVEQMQGEAKHSFSYIKQYRLFHMVNGIVIIISVGITGKKRSEDVSLFLIFLSARDWGCVAGGRVHEVGQAEALIHGLQKK